MLPCVVDLNAVSFEIRNHAVVHGARLLGGPLCVLHRRIWPVARIARFDSPFRQFGKVGLLPLYLPAIGQEVAERVEVVPKWKLDALRRQRTFQRLLRRLLRQPARVSRYERLVGKQSLCSVKIFGSESEAGTQLPC